MPRLVLYKHDVSPPSSAVLMLADVLGLTLEHREPALLKAEHKTPEYRKMNPMATIPVLQDGNFTVSESHAIITYLVEKYGSDKRASLYPADFESRAIIHERMHFDTGVLFIKLRSVSLPTVKAGLTGVTEELKASIEDGYGILEAYLTRSRYVAGDHLTIADFSVGSTAMFLQPMVELDREKFPKTGEWLDLLMEEPSFKEIGKTGVAKFTAFLNMFWEKNKQAQQS